MPSFFKCCISEEKAPPLVNPFSREEWKKNPLDCLIKSFKEKMRDYKGGDIHIQIPRTDEEIAEGWACDIIVKVMILAGKFCNSSIIAADGTGLLIIQENPYLDKSENTVMRFALAIEQHENRKLKWLEEDQRKSDLDEKDPLIINGLQLKRLRIT